MSMLRNGKNLVNVKFVLSLGKKSVKFELNKLLRLWDYLRSQFPFSPPYNGANMGAESWELELELEVYKFLT